MYILWQIKLANMYYRCFPHVVNISCQAVISELTKNPTEPVLTSSTNPAHEIELESYARALEQDLIGSVRGLVAACCASGQQR